MATSNIGTTGAVFGSIIFAAGEAAPVDPLNQDVAQGLGLMVEVTYDPVINRSVGHQLFGAAGNDTAEAIYFTVAHTMLGGIASPSAYRDVVQYLGFTDRHFEDVTQLIFRDNDPGVVSVAQTVAAANYFFGTPSLANTVVRAFNADSSLGWFSTLAQVFENDIVERMGLTEATDTSATGYGRTTTQGGVLKQSISLTVTDNTCREEQYAPLIGESGDDSFESMAAAGPALTDGDTLTLTYPSTSPTLTLVLENPDMGNDDTFNFTRINRQTRGGDRKLLTKGKWATWERLEVDISGIECNATIDEIITFLNTSLGKEIGFADWEGRTWKGVIVAPDTDIIEQQTGRALKLVFEGEVTTFDVQHGDFDVIHGQHTDGTDIQVTYEESE